MASPISGLVENLQNIALYGAVGAVVTYLVVTLALHALFPKMKDKKNRGFTHAIAIFAALMWFWFAARHGFFK